MGRRQSARGLAARPAQGSVRKDNHKELNEMFGKMKQDLQKELVEIRDAGLYKEERIIPVNDIPMFGIHNQENVMSSTLIGFLFGIPPLPMRESIKAFQSLEHRLEEVATLQNVVFYNDSKATNVGATIKSLESFDNKIILILGGRDKGGNFERLKKPVEEHVKKILLIGEAKEKIERALENDSRVPMEPVSSLKEAVELGFASASPGEIVLLAPACTSFDMFQNFEERGRVFKQEVFALIERIKTKGN